MACYAIQYGRLHALFWRFTQQLIFETASTQLCGAVVQVTSLLSSQSAMGESGSTRCYRNVCNTVDIIISILKFYINVCKLAFTV